MAAAPTIAPPPAAPTAPGHLTTPRLMTATLEPHVVIDSVPASQLSPTDPAPVDNFPARAMTADSKHVSSEAVSLPSPTGVEGGDPVVAPGSAVDDADRLSDAEGRLTPLASESSRLSRSGSSDPMPSSPHSLSMAPTTQSSIPTVPSVAQHHMTPMFNSLPVAPAEMGLSSLGTERQLRDAAIGKDRMLILLIAREMEAFITRAMNGEQPPFVVPPGGAILSVFTMASPLTTTTTSKFQRMLVYKAAEWYGLRGISGPDNIIFIGTTGPLNERSASLKLADLAPKPPTPKQNFKIMQRVPVGSSGSASSRAASVAGESEASGSKFMTMEEREANYALARERIFKEDQSTTTSDPSSAPASNVDEGEDKVSAVRQQGRTDDDDDFVPRRAVSAVQPVYGSLYHPRPEQNPGPPIAQHGQFHTQYAGAAQSHYGPSDQMFAYQPNMHPGYGYGMAPDGYANGQPMQNGYAGQVQQGYPAAAFHNAGDGYISAGYPAGQWVPYPNHQAQMNGHDHMAQLPLMGPGYGYPPAPQMGSTGPMPMIPQGAQAYPPQYGYPPYQSGNYTPLVQPTPLRPALPQHQHSSTSSSISSRSYQDYSRPHSRGSTTSTRSAASSVRMGAMYPASSGGSGARYRQQGMKGQPPPPMYNSTTDTRAARAHSPVSRSDVRGPMSIADGQSSNASSQRSTKRKTSISVHPPAPGQHQLPQRPDWAANNIQYRPAPYPFEHQHHPGGMGGQYAPGYGMPGQMGHADSSEFPPLLRNGFNAEPMQSERTKIGPRSGVWNGHGGRGGGHANGRSQPAPTTTGQNGTNATNGASGSAGMNGSSRSAAMPSSSAMFVDGARSSTPGPRHGQEDDPDFPRRAPSSKPPGTLFDPKQSLAGTHAISRPQSAASVRTAGSSARAKANDGDGAETGGMSAQDVIEAKLAALSVSSGIDIGPPVVKSPSYAKIVRRD